MVRSSQRGSLSNKKEKRDSPNRRACSFSWEKLIEMKNQKTQFFAGDGFKRLRILDLDEKTKNIHMVCELGKKTWPLNFAKLEELHQLVHEGKLSPLPYEIDRLLPTWGNFISGLFRHFGCEKGK